MGKSDPYAILKFGKQSDKTNILKNTLEPQWNHHCEFEEPDTRCICLWMRGEEYLPSCPQYALEDIFVAPLCGRHLSPSPLGVVLLGCSLVGRVSEQTFALAGACVQH